MAVPGILGAYYLDLNSGSAVGVRDRERFPAASVVKVPILLEVLRQAGEGLLSLRERFALASEHRVGGAGVLLELEEGTSLTLLELARLMTVVSDNVASNALLDRVGMEPVNRLMAALGMQDSHLGRRFMEVPEGERDNWTTARDIALCMASIWRGEVAGSREALEILRRQQYREKIPCMLPGELGVANKTGELDGVRHDAAIVEHPRYPYVLTLLTRDGGAAWEVDRALAHLSRAVYDLVDAAGPPGRCEEHPAPWRS
ncbi:MAG: serine hydrolase [Candidatus Eremiobacterota bacterium]